MMMRRRGQGQFGLTLPEVMVGISIFIFIAASTIWSLMSLSQGNDTVSINHRVTRLFDTSRSELRFLFADPVKYANATDLVGTERPTLSPTDPEITVISTVEDIIDGRRKITLTASWEKRGITQTKVQTFYLSQIRARLDGALVMVRVVDEVGDSVEGVKITPFLDPGQGEVGVDGPVGYKITDTYGTVIFDGIRALASGIKLKVDGRSIVHYFPHSVDPLLTAFSKDYQTDQTYSGKTNDYYYNSCPSCHGPIVMRAPGYIEGDAVDYVGGDVIGDAKVVINKKTVEMKKNEDGTLYVLTLDQEEVYTNVDGIFTSPPLVPGTYFVSFVGNSEYAALAKPKDYHLLQGSTGEYVTVTPKDTVNISEPIGDGGLGHNFRAVKRGSLSGTVYRVTYNTGLGQFEAGAAAPEDMILRFFQSQRLVKHKDGPTITDFDMTWTTPFRDHLFAAREFSTFLTNSSGIYGAAYFTPLLAHRDIGTYNPTGTYNIVRIRPYNRNPAYGASNVTLPDPMTPVQILPIGGNFPRTPANVKFLVTTRSGANNTANRIVKALPIAGGAGPAAISDFDHEVYVNQVGSGNDLYFLDRQALGSVSGALTDGDGGPVWDPGFLEVRWLRTYWGTNGHGALMLRNSSSPNLDTAYMNAWPYIKAQAQAPNPENYSFSDATTNPSNAGRILVPNLGTDKTIIYFRGTNIVQHTKNFVGVVDAWKRILDSNSIFRYVKVADADVDLDLIAKAYRYRNGGEWTPFDDTNISVTDGAFIAGKPVREMTIYKGQSAPIVVPPAADLPGVPIPIQNVGSPDPYFEQYHVAVQGSADDLWAPNCVPYEGHIAKGPVFTYNTGLDEYRLDTTAPDFVDPDTLLPVQLSVIRKVPVNLSGIVTEGADGTGNPLAGVLVQLVDFNLVGESGNEEGILDIATTQTDGTFSFPRHNIIPTPFWNVQMIFSAAGYQTTTSGRYSVYTPDDYTPWTMHVTIGIEKEPDYTGSGQAGN